MWGVSVSAHQTEGNNFYNDWWYFEKKGTLPYKSGDACLHYEYFEKDFDALKSLGFNAFRFSIEWSRIEPSEGKINHKELKHYFKVIEALKKRNIVPMVVLFHFTLPLWFYRKGGFSRSSNIKHFLNFVKIISGELKGINWWITINEPCVYVYQGFLQGVWPPFRKSLKLSLKTLLNLLKAHQEAFYIIKENNPQSQVSFSKHMRGFYPSPRGNIVLNQLPAFLRNFFFNRFFLEVCAHNHTLDYIALNYYTCNFLKFKVKKIMGEEDMNLPLRKNSLGWYVHPASLGKILSFLKKFNLPVIITENGTSEDEELFYEAFLKAHLLQVLKSLKKGIPVKGYFWWSLIDNFEWDKGFNAYFGIFSVDRNSGERKSRPFCKKFSEIIKTNSL